MADGENKGQRLLALRYVEGSTVHEDCADEKEILAELQQVRMQDSLLRREHGTI